MGTGYDGTYVLTIDQTSLDGKPATIGERLKAGQVWRRQGEAVRIDGSQSTLMLGQSVGQDALRARVAQVVQRRFDLPRTEQRFIDVDCHTNGYVVTDGDARFSLVPIATSEDRPDLIWCPDGVPAADHDYRVEQVPEDAVFTRQSKDLDGDVICFTENTRIATQDGHKLVEMLRPGDFVQTMDNGTQEILWIGTRRMSGARLHATPELRPIRIRAHALSGGVPDGDLLVSPHHRMLYEGRNAQTLFNTPHVLVSAQDMINDHSIFVDYSVKEVTYFHLLFAEHQIVWANGVPTESFHPASTTLTSIAEDQRADLLDVFPELDLDLHSYGPQARRLLQQPEAAILLHDVA